MKVEAPRVGFPAMDTWIVLLDFKQELASRALPFPILDQDVIPMVPIVRALIGNVVRPSDRGVSVRHVWKTLVRRI